MLDLNAVDSAGNETVSKIQFQITKVLPPAVKEIVTKKEKKQIKKDIPKREFPKLWMIFLAGTGSILLCTQIVRNHRKNKHS